MADRTLADEILTMVWAFPAGDERRDAVRDLAARVGALEAQNADLAKRLADTTHQLGIARAVNEKSGSGKLDQAMRQACEERDAAEGERDGLRKAARALVDLIGKVASGQNERDPNQDNMVGWTGLAQAQIYAASRALLEALGDGGER